MLQSGPVHGGPAQGEAVCVPPQPPSQALLAEGDNLLWAAWTRAQREVSTALGRRGQVLGARRRKKEFYKTMKL